MRVRLLALVSAVALFGLAAVPASAGSEGHDYLALGDSVPFGFSPLLNPNDASNFIGYPEIVAQRLDIKDVNATCPGEATGGFLSLTGTDNVCRPYRAAFPLHTQYNVSQMDYALRYLTGHKDTRLITLTLGANDLFRWQKDCMVKDQPFGTCPLGFFGVLGVMQANLHTIFSKIRSTGYTGLIVAVSYYALNYADPGGALALQATIVSAGSTFGVKLASGFNAWAPVAATKGGDSCAAGLLIPTPLGSTPCDVHPTPLGRDLLAGAVINTIAATCSAHDAVACLDVNR